VGIRDGLPFPHTQPNELRDHVTTGVKEYGEARGKKLTMLIAVGSLLCGRGTRGGVEIITFGGGVCAEAWRWRSQWSMFKGRQSVEAERIGGSTRLEEKSY